MIKCKLAEFYSSKGYAFEILESNKFDVLQMDDKWKEHFLADIVNDEHGCWEITDCELEPILQLSVSDEGWEWYVGKKLIFNSYYKQVKVKSGIESMPEIALEKGLDAFEEMLQEEALTDLEDIDDDFTEIKP